MNPHASGTAPSAADADAAGIFPQSFAQRRLWFVDRTQPGSAAYSISRAYLLAGPLNVEARRRRGRDRPPVRVAAHRVRLGRRNAVQVVLPRIDLPLAVEEVDGPTPEARREGALRRARDKAARPFDLERGPLLRVTLLRMGDAEHALVLVMHHIVSDGWSMGVLFSELGALYDAFCAACPPGCPRCRCSTPSTPPGSGRGWPGRG